MSKFFEALLQAESDRLSTLQTGEAPRPATAAVPSQPVSYLVASAVAVQEFAPPAALTPPRPVPQNIPGDIPELPVPPVDLTPLDLALVDLARVPRVKWSPSTTELPALLKRGGQVEQFRGLRSRIHEFRDLNSLRSLMVSSGYAAEGKSFVAANLAISLAQYKSSRVLLIDGDMRRGSLDKLLGTRNEPGLTDYLAGKASITEVLQFPQAGPTGGLLKGLSTMAFIPSGPDGANAADLSGNGRFQKMLDAMYPLFDWIVIDSSPVNLVSDSVNLARSCDGVLLVTRSAVTKFETAQRALIQLKASNVIGVVLNAVVKPPAVGGYYGYDNYERTDEQGAH